MKNQNFMPFTDWATYGFANLVQLHKDYKADTGATMNLRDFIIGFYQHTTHGQTKQGKKSWKDATRNFEWLKSVYQENYNDSSLAQSLLELTHYEEIVTS